MNTFKKSLISVFSILCLTLLLISLSSCGTCDHEWGEWQMLDEKANLCVDACEQYRICKKDDTHFEYRTVNPTGHNFGGEYGTSSSEHWQVCQNEGCKEREIAAHKSNAPATADTPEYCATCGYEMAPKYHPLSNKKIMFIGNSHTYFGGVVKEISQANKHQSYRTGDRGFFYNLCKENGAVNVEVTNWTFGGHSLSDLFSGDCQANRDCGNGTDHASYLTDLNYDYVVIQQGSNTGNNLAYWVEHVMDLFREGNANTKFIFLVHARAYNDNYPWLDQVDDIENLGCTIVDWGDLVYDVYSGNTAVPGAECAYTKHSFIISKDDFHPGLLSGYIISTMVYCAITGESAIGQPYEFCSQTRSFSSYISSHYTKGGTNFPEIFASSSDMQGLQTLMDQYLEGKYYKNN